MREFHRRQGGFSSLVAIMITLSVVSFFFMLVGERLVTQQIVAQAEPFYERLLNLRDQIYTYQRDKYDNGTSPSDKLLFPQTFTDLSPGYIPACTNSDNLAGLCSTIAQTPWNTDMTYVVQADTSFFPVRYRALVTIPLPGKGDPVSEREYQVYADVLSRLGGARFNAARTKVEWRISRVGDALAFDQFIKKRRVNQADGRLGYRRPERHCQRNGHYPGQCRRFTYKCRFRPHPRSGHSQTRRVGKYAELSLKPHGNPVVLFCRQYPGYDF